MSASNIPKPSQRSLVPVALLLLAAALAAYFFWTRFSAGRSDSTAPTPEQLALPASGGATGPALAADGRRYSGAGIEVDANGARILNDAGLPISSQPLPVAKPIPIDAPPSATIGYTKDAQGVVRPVRAGDLAVVPNSPGNYTVVDMWADGGPTVVPATKGVSVSPAELARQREAEARAERTRR